MSRLQTSKALDLVDMFNDTFRYLDDIEKHLWYLSNSTAAEQGKFMSKRNSCLRFKYLSNRPLYPYQVDDKRDDFGCSIG